MLVNRFDHLSVVSQCCRPCGPSASLMIEVKRIMHNCDIDFKYKFAKKGVGLFLLSYDSVVESVTNGRSSTFNKYERASGQDPPPTIKHQSSASPFRIDNLQLQLLRGSSYWTSFHIVYLNITIGYTNNATIVNAEKSYATEISWESLYSRESQSAIKREVHDSLPASHHDTFFIADRFP